MVLSDVWCGCVDGGRLGWFSWGVEILEIGEVFWCGLLDDGSRVQASGCSGEAVHGQLCVDAGCCALVGCLLGWVGAGFPAAFFVLDGIPAFAVGVDPCCYAAFESVVAVVGQDLGWVPQHGYGCSCGCGVVWGFGHGCDELGQAFPEGVCGVSWDGLSWSVCMYV